RASLFSTCSRSGRTACATSRPSRAGLGERDHTEGAPGMTGTVPYDECGLLAENAAEAGLPFPGPPAVRRQSFTVAAGQTVSAIVWGTAAPELVLLHGGR